MMILNNDVHDSNENFFHTLFVQAQDKRWGEGQVNSYAIVTVDSG